MISVVMPVYNAGPFLAESIESVLGQTIADLELVIVDDVSTDGSLDIARSYEARDARVRVIRQAVNQRSSAARNRGADEARGEWLAFLDCDDVCLPHRLERQMAAAAEHPAVLLWGSAVEIISGDGKPLGINVDGPVTLDEYRERLRIGQPNGVLGSTIFVRRSTYFDVGGFDPDMSLVDDTDFADRVGTLGPVLSLTEPLVKYRKHAGQVSSQQFFEQAMMDRYLWVRGVARARGESVVPFREWLAVYARSPAWRRWRDRSYDRSRLYVRRGVYSFTERRYLHALGMLIVSVPFNPVYLPRRAWSRTIGARRRARSSSPPLLTTTTARTSAEVRKRGAGIGRLRTNQSAPERFEEGVDLVGERDPFLER